MTVRRPKGVLAIIVPLWLGWLVATTVVPPAQAGDADREEDADPRAEASKRFRQGVKLYNDGDFVAALVEFKRAYELKPHYRVLYNLGQTSRGLKDYAAALHAYEQYLEEGGTKLKPQRRKEVEGHVEDLTARVGTLTVTTNVDGAEIQIDDVVVGVSPLDEPIVVNVGRRRIVATLTGHAPARRVLEVAGTDELEVELELTDLEADRPPSPV
ncbi:MAG: PEGA domain-containing protein, partial [Deltaproteobacteria bacterium]|nr:PEGA domain-containing protein [Deltaproteobacteria bacterium]